VWVFEKENPWDFGGGWGVWPGPNAGVLRNEEEFDRKDAKFAKVSGWQGVVCGSEGFFNDWNFGC